MRLLLLLLFFYLLILGRELNSSIGSVSSTIFETCIFRTSCFQGFFAISGDGERKDRDEENRERDEQASDLLEA